MSTSDPKARPHRRLSLTMPTQPPAQEAPATEAVVEDKSSAVDEQPATPEATTRVMAYLTTEEAQLLDELWMARRSTSRPSKSDLLRAALTLASQEQRQLDNVLSEQRSSTLLRQRNSKAVWRRVG